MQTILLACAAGMSTSLLVNKMKKAAEKENEEYKIYAVGLAGVEQEVSNNEIDIILLGPQVRFNEKDFKSKYEPEIKVSVIDAMDYGTMNGEKVFNKVKELLG